MHAFMPEYVPACACAISCAFPFVCAWQQTAFPEQYFDAVVPERVVGPYLNAVNCAMIIWAKFMEESHELAQGQSQVQAPAEKHGKILDREALLLKSLEEKSVRLRETADPAANDELPCAGNGLRSDRTFRPGFPSLS